VQRDEVLAGKDEDATAHTRILRPRSCAYRRAELNQCRQPVMRHDCFRAPRAPATDERNGDVGGVRIRLHEAGSGRAQAPNLERRAGALRTIAFAPEAASTARSRWRRTGRPDRARSAPRRAIAFAQMRARKSSAKCAVLDGREVFSGLPRDPGPAEPRRGRSRSSWIDCAGNSSTIALTTPAFVVLSGPFGQYVGRVQLARGDPQRAGGSLRQSGDGCAPVRAGKRALLVPSPYLRCAQALVTDRPFPRLPGRV
jgi:hypothetical protein